MEGAKRSKSHDLGIALVSAILGGLLTYVGTIAQIQASAGEARLDRKLDAYERFLSVVKSPCGYNLDCLRRRMQVTTAAIFQSPKRSAVRDLLRRYELLTLKLWNLVDGQGVIPRSRVRLRLWTAQRELVPEIMNAMDAESAD